MKRKTALAIVAVMKSNMTAAHKEIACDRMANGLTFKWIKEHINVLSHFASGANILVERNGKTTLCCGKEHVFLAHKKYDFTYMSYEEWNKCAKHSH